MRRKNQKERLRALDRERKKSREREARAKEEEQTGYVATIVVIGDEMTLEDFDESWELYDTDMADGGSNRTLKIQGAPTSEGFEEREKLRKNVGQR